jgi:hypothetical protein
MRRARARRLGVQLAIAVAVFGSAAYRLLAPQPQIATRESTRAEPASTPAPAPAAPAAASTRACEQRDAPEAQWSFAAGRTRVELGQVGAIAVDDGAQMWIDASERCRVRLRLLAGRVRVHAADLGGGELRVVTPSGDVVVHGTTFGVAHDAAGLTVDVDEGRVSVHPRSAAARHMVEAGQRLHAGISLEPRIEPLPDGERAAIRSALAEADGDTAPALRDGASMPQASAARLVRATHDDGSARTPPRVPSPPSAAELVSEADALWLRGERDAARDRYRQAGSLDGPTAEAAWLTLARRELSAKAPAAARAALGQYRARFEHGKLTAEADGIAFRAALEQGDVGEARRVAERLVASAPHTPQAEAAQRWLKSQR